MTVFCVAFRGRMTCETVEEKLSSLSSRLTTVDDGVSLLFDLLEMEGYDLETRHQYIAWHRKHANQIRRVAVVTERTLIGAVVSAMGLTARGHFKTFKNFLDAERWCKQDDPHASLR